MSRGEMLEALRDAHAHVYRQQFYGAHVQDRLDATEWLRLWGDRISEEARLRKLGGVVRIWPIPTAVWALLAIDRIDIARCGDGFRWGVRGDGWVVRIKSGSWLESPRQVARDLSVGRS